MIYNLGILIDCLYFQLKNGNNDPTRDSCYKYYMPLIEIKDFDASIEPKYSAIFLSINNKTQCVPLLFLSSRFMTYVPSFSIDKLCLEKTPWNLGS